MFKNLIVNIFLVLFPIFIVGKPIDLLQYPKTTFYKADFENKLDSLKKNYGINKTLHPKYELQILIALSKYPELKNTEIEFISRKVISVMVAQPVICKLIGKRSKRKYKIIFNEDENAPIPINKATFNAQIGVLGHELGHIAYYEKVSSMKLLWDIIRYPFSKFKRKFEQETDKRAVEHDLGWQLYDWRMYCFSTNKNNKKYIENKTKYYLTPEKIYQTLIAD